MSNNNEFRPRPPQPLGEEPPPSGSQLATTGTVSLLVAAILFSFTGVASDRLVLTGLLIASALAGLFGAITLAASFFIRPK